MATCASSPRWSRLARRRCDRLSCGCFASGSLPAETGWSPVDFDFTGVSFENADFSGLWFRGTVVFDRADFLGESTSFAGSRFEGGLSCHGTRFATTRTTFARARFAGPAEFVGAEFACRELDCQSWEVTGGQIDFYRCLFPLEKLDFGALTIEDGQVQFEKVEFADAELDFRYLGTGWGSREGFPRLTFEEVRFVRCRLDLEFVSSRERMVWFVDAVLDTVTVTCEQLEDVTPWLATPRPWLNLRNVELRGGTELPEKYVRRQTLA